MRLQVAGGGVVSVRQSTLASRENRDLDTERGLAFMGGVARVGVAATFSLVEIANPAASGVIVFVDSMVVTSAASTAVTLRHTITTATNPSAASNNKDIAQGLGAAVLGSATAGAATGSQFHAMTINVNRPVTIRFDPPIRLAEGEEIGAWNGNVNTTLTVSYQWREI